MTKGDIVNSLSYNDYERILNQSDVREKIAIELAEQHSKLKRVNIEDLSATLKAADKDLYVRFKNGEYTLDQLKARIAERWDGTKYKVLDDLKEQLKETTYFEEDQ